jgi:hypothetical protein
MLLAGVQRAEPSGNPSAKYEIAYILFIFKFRKN